MQTTESNKTTSRVQAKTEQEQPFFAPSFHNRQEGVGKTFSGGKNSDSPTFIPARSKPVIQQKLTINEPGDQYEQEADAVADRVMCMTATPGGGDEKPVQAQTLPIASLQRQCAGCDMEDKVQRQKMEVEEPLQRKAITAGGFGGSEPIAIQRKCTGCELEDKVQRQEMEDEEPVQRKKITSGGFGGSEPMVVQRKCAGCDMEDKVQRQEMEDEPFQAMPLMRKAPDGGYAATPQLQSQLNSSKGGGSPLPGPTLTSMSQAFGADFSSVRIHTDSRAAEMSQGIQAKAFTHGADIYFNRGQFSPESGEGKRLLGHELTHVVQQNSINRNLKENWYPNERLIQKQEADKEAPKKTITREEEIKLSQISEGKTKGTAKPLSISLYNYAINDSNYKKSHQSLLTELSDFLKNVKLAVFKILVAGHTDSSGEFDANENLSEKRAKKIFKSLKGLTNIVVEMAWQGENNPITENETVEGRSRNRRVDIEFWPIVSYYIGPHSGTGKSFKEKPAETEPQQTTHAEPKQEGKTDQPETTKPGMPENPKKQSILQPDTLCQKYPVICKAFKEKEQGDDEFPFVPFLPILYGIGVSTGGGLLTGIGGAIGGVAGALRKGIGSLYCEVTDSCDSSEPPDKEPPDKESPESDEPLPIVKFGPINGTETPNGMNARIPPRKDTYVDITISGWKEGMLPISITIVGAGSINGTAYINGTDKIEMIKSGKIAVRGDIQTEPGHRGGVLQLIASQGYNKIGEGSNYFAVTSIMHTMSAMLKEKVTDYRGNSVRGMISNMSWRSDSDVITDLDRVKYSEKIKDLGNWNGNRLGSIDSSREFNPSDKEPPVKEDRHLMSLSLLNRPAKLETDQIYVFIDKRLDPTQKVLYPVKNSGFRITRELKQDEELKKSTNGKYCYYFIVSKQGLKVNIDSIESEAGRTSPESPISSKQEIPCKLPKPPKPKPPKPTPLTPEPKTPEPKTHEPPTAPPARPQTQPPSPSDGPTMRAAPPLKGPPPVWCGDIGCSTWALYRSLVKQSYSMLTEAGARELIEHELHLLLMHRPAAPPNTDPYAQPTVHRRYTLLKIEARRRVLKAFALEGLINTNYAK